VERLSREHDRAVFDCGQPALDEWLQSQAGQFDRRDLARTFVAVRSPQPQVLGYYALASHRVRYEALPDDQSRGLPHIDIPVILLARLAVDRVVQGQGLGEFLLIDALRRAEQVAQQVGIRAVEVDAIDDRARAFYLKYGFVGLRDDVRHLFLPMQAIRKLGLPP
jgi:GNAT superfamily N-acetyltransferase